jgi:penicillin-binding protein 1A
LTLPEAALLAALPKGPEYYSPVRSPERALRRRNLVLSEMEDDRKITAAQAAAAKAAPLGLHLESAPNSVAPYFVEELRRQLEKEYGVEEVHGSGLRVYTTLDLDLQVVANRAVMNGVATYERRHGWKGHLPNIVLEGFDMESYRHPDWWLPVEAGSYLHGLVTAVEAKQVTVKLGSREAVLTPADWKWTGNVDGDSFLKNGDVVYVKVDAVAAEGTVHATLQQDSGAQASMMAVDNSSGEVLAMVGGRDFALSQFNRATQAQRQVGSSFKPYVYTTAVEAGSKPTDVIVDGPTSFPTPNGPYTPHNYEADYKGAMTLLNAFAESRNIPALKLANQVGIRKVIEMAHRFGVTSNIPVFLPVAIGAADITLYEQVGSYSVFPNDGIRIEPHYIRKVTRADGMQMPEDAPEVKEVISVETARTMMEFLQAVTRIGTGASAAQLKHPLGGKTGTTNDFTDAWFIGFSPSVTCGTWIGFDDRQSLGEKETGARAALPMWIEFMKAAIANKPDEAFAAAGAPKKVLDVPLTPPAGAGQKAPAKPEEGSDAPVGRAASRQASPAPAIPGVERGTPRPAGPVAPAPAAAPATTPAKPAEENRSGVSKPPPDTN